MPRQEESKPAGMTTPTGIHARSSGAMTIKFMKSMSTEKGFGFLGLI
jgi:hypothetical protein